MVNIIEILEDVRPDLDFTDLSNFVDGGILDSFDIITLIEKLGDEFGIEIDPEDIIPSNFNSVEAIEALVCKYNN